MGMFIAKTDVNELIVVIENVSPGIVDISVHGKIYFPGRIVNGFHAVPGFYLESAYHGMKADTFLVMEEVRKAINYHFNWDEENEKKFLEWLENERIYWQ